MRQFTILVLALTLVAFPAAAVDYVRLSPSEFAEDLARASTLASEANYDEAIVILGTLIEDEPLDADALSLMGYCLRKSGRASPAEAFYLRALEVEPDHLGANQYLGEFYLERGDLELARERLAVLDATCGDRCEGRDALAAAIAAIGTARN